MKTYKVWRALHGVTHRHRWNLTLEGPDDTRVTAAAAFTCRPCRVTRTVAPPARPFNPCFCRDANCVDWRAYVAHFVDSAGVEPDEDDIVMDERIYAARDAMVRKYGTGGSATPFLTALALSDREVTR